MPTKEQLQDMVEALTTLNIRQLDEEGRDEAEYLVNDIIISIEELMDFFSFLSRVRLSGASIP